MSINQRVSSKAEDFSGWYRETVTQARLAACSPIGGCMTMRPQGYAVWTSICEALTTFVEDHKPRNAHGLFYLYHDFCRDYLAIPTAVRQRAIGKSSNNIAWQHLTKGLMSNEYAVQIDAINCLNDIFLDMAEASFINYDNLKKKPAQITEWEFVVHLIEAVITVHGDDKGLVLPPQIAPTQVLIIPTEFELRPAAFRIRRKLLNSGIRAEVDDRSRVRTDEKIRESESCGIPLRIEFGLREARQGKVLVVFRHDGNKHLTSFRSGIFYSFPSSVGTMLQIMQSEMMRRVDDGN